MDRQIYQKLLEWKAGNNRKPLILNGARQVGKTWLLKTFGQQEYENIAYINCDKNQVLQEVFGIDYDMKRIIRSLSALAEVDIQPGNTLLILDEIQSAPKALASLKYFCEDAPNYHVAVAGSLLGIALHQEESFPVGKIDMLRIFPMNFEEFLLALGKKQMYEIVCNKDYTVMNTLSDAFIDLLRQYYYVGGMPEVVQAYISDEGLQKVRTLQKQILFDYAKDFSKHAPSREVPRINMVWQSIPAQLAKENKKFIYGAMKKGARATEFEIAIQWLIDTGLVHRVNRCRQPFLPLKMYEDISAFKLFIVDCGLLGAMVDAPASQILIGNSIFKEYKGAFTEQYVLQQMVSKDEYSIYYYSSDDSRMEIDFLIQQEALITPIEVKAESNIRANSLSQYLKEHPELTAIRYSMLPYKLQEHLINIPLYAIL